MDLEAMITEAQARRDQKTREHIDDQERRAANLAADLEQRFRAVFGDDLFASLGAKATCAIDAPARIGFNYNTYGYSLRRGTGDFVNEWTLTRRDARADGDERPLPHTTFTASARHYTTDEAVDVFLLALADLDAEPELPPAPRREFTPVAPRVMNEFEANLLDALREYLQHEL